MLLCTDRVLCVLLQLRHFRQDHRPPRAEPSRRCKAVSSIPAFPPHDELVDIHERLGDLPVHYLVHVRFHIRYMVGYPLDGLIRVLFMELLEPSGSSSRAEQLCNFRAQALLSVL